MFFLLPFFKQKVIENIEDALLGDEFLLLVVVFDDALVQSPLQHRERYKAALSLRLELQRQPCTNVIPQLTTLLDDPCPTSSDQTGELEVFERLR